MRSGNGLRTIATIMAMAEAASQMGDAMTYKVDNRPTPYTKSPLSKKQLKARKKSKLAKQSRKQNR
jgi:hypothetical protein